MTASSVEYMEVRWRVKGTNEAWGAPVRTAPTGDLVVEELDRSKQYEFEARNVSHCGAVSVWVPSDYTVPNALGPVAVDVLTAQSLADGVHLGWTSVDTPAPAAGIEYCVERSADGTTGWVQRIRLRATAYTDPETSGAVFYYRVRAVNYAGTFGPYSPVASSKGVNVGDIAGAASAAAADAAAAQAAAAAATYELASIASDNILSPVEKAAVIRDYNVLVAEQAGIDAEASAYGITTEKAAYDAARLALTTYLATLTAPVLWSNVAGNTTIVGPTFRDNFASVYTTRQTLLNAIYAKAKAIADGAAATANDSAPASIVNPGFENGLYGWTPDGDAANWYAETGANGPNAGTTKYVVHKISSVTTNLINAGVAPVVVGQVIKATCKCRGLAITDGAARITILWLNSAKTVIGNAPSAQFQAAAVTSLSVNAVAPAGAAYARVMLSCGFGTSGGTGYFTFDDVAWNYQASSLDEVPDGAAYGKVSGDQLVAGRLPPGSVGKNMLANPGFEINTVGFPAMGFAGPNKPFVDGWVTGAINETNPSLGGVSLNQNVDITFDGLNCALTCFRGGHVIPAGAGHTATLNSINLPIRQNDSILLSCVGHYFNGAGYAPVAAGITATGIAGVSFYAQDGTYLNGQYGTIHPFDGYQSISLVATAPPGVAYMRVTCWANLNNATGASYTLPGTYPLDVRWDDFSCSSIINLDNEIKDGVTYGRVSQSDLVSNRVGLGVAGSGMRIGDQRNLTAVTFGNYGAAWSGLGLSYTATTTSATITASAATLYAGSATIIYGVSHITLTGTAGSTRVYHLFYDDPTLSGGAKTLQATTSDVTAVASDGRVYLTDLSITFPTSGTGGGSGNGNCPLREAWVIRRGADGNHEHVPAGDVLVGDHLLLVIGRWGRVSHSSPAMAPCVRVESAEHHALSCSTTAPLGTRGGSVLASQAAGADVLTLIGTCAPRISHIARVEDLGEQWVQHITCEDDFFWAGDDPACMFAHHNLKLPPRLP